jgi:beta-phosphoglucomutase
MISAVLFDFDGVIVDSERLHWAAFNAVLNPLDVNITWDEYIKVYIGFDDRDAFRTVFPMFGKTELADLIEAKAAAFQELLADGGAAALPGAVELIQHLSGKIPIAICSGALREDIVPIIGKLGVADAFDTIVTAEDTPRSKPDPAPYRLTAERLGISEGLVIEDTPAGIASAQGAGLKVLAVTNSYEREFLTAADWIVDSLEGITLEKLNEELSA